MPIPKELRYLYKTATWFAARANAKLRARDRCERCNRPNGAWVVDEKGRRVEVTARDAEAARVRQLKVTEIICGGAHLNGIAGDDRFENVAWLCRGDHLRHDKAQHRRTRQQTKDLARPLFQEVA